MELFILLTNAFAADPAPTQLKEVTVTATPEALAEQREAVSQKTVIDRKEIEALGGLTVGEVIRKLPGIEAGEHGADGGLSARARGMSRDVVQFLVNGERPTANARFALTQVGRMPAGELERIEILRGGAAEFGGAAAVTVNLVMRQPVARASLSGAIRFPKLEELTAVVTRSASANSPLEPDRGGNPALKPERIASLEAGLERHLAGGVLGANVYLRRTEDFVERRTLLEGARWVDRPANEGDARHWGLELSAKLKGDGLLPLPRDGSLRAQLTLPRGEVHGARLGIDRKPRELPRYNFSLGYEGSLPAWQSTWGLHWQRNGPVKTAVPGELAADTRRFASARSGADTWQLDTREAGQRTWLLSLEGKW